ncbi:MULTISPECIES: helix-turn-helix domain-containing protein [Emticicia]|uniref:winged helix-turn-helix transcriptional regulator n=1 Tax=Emticicia TaxID=312278 RepID=UPI00209D78F5|nr:MULTISPECIES: helix-turn-helix domain-containing protein [Emticicia]UTA66192.1 helix-turn-helix transcriptional regulator [Emticicia sp. 21SJ11W-3]
MKKRATVNTSQLCRKRISTIKDTMEILSGKWKFHILGTLMERDHLRFMDLLREVDGIGTKMLAKELQDMEMNQLVSRTILDTRPVTVQYSLTEFGKTLNPIIDEIIRWGNEYRSSIVGKEKEV